MSNTDHRISLLRSLIKWIIPMNLLLVGCDRGDIISSVTRETETSLDLNDSGMNIIRRKTTPTLKPTVTAAPPSPNSCWVTEQEYLNLYPDIAAYGISPFLHYKFYGSREGRCQPVGACSLAVHTSEYFRLYEDALKTETDPFIHYSKYGVNQGFCPPSKQVPYSPRTVTEADHLAIMEYATWWGPDAEHFESSAFIPELSSKSMKERGLIGYDSADSDVLKQHASWMEFLSIDAVLMDLSNGVHCTFTTDINDFEGCYGNRGKEGNRKNFFARKDNFQNLYKIWRKIPTKLKIVPLLGGSQDLDFQTDKNGKIPLESQLEFMLDLYTKYPEMSLLYENKPFLLFYAGSESSPILQNNVKRIENVMSKGNFNQKFTVRFLTGFKDSNPNLWKSTRVVNNTRETHPSYPFWSWWERLNPQNNLYPTYVTQGNHVESFTVSFATPGYWSDLPGMPWFNAEALDIRTTPRRNGQTFRDFMALARNLKPTFLLINQFNEYLPPEQGKSAETTSNIEPNLHFGHQGLGLVKEQMNYYKKLFE